jgi:hypothetical protein
MGRFSVCENAENVLTIIRPNQFVCSKTSLLIVFWVMGGGGALAGFQYFFSTYFEDSNCLKQCLSNSVSRNPGVPQNIVKGAARNGGINT